MHLWTSSSSIRSAAVIFVLFWNSIQDSCGSLLLSSRYSLRLKYAVTDTTKAAARSMVPAIMPTVIHVWVSGRPGSRRVMPAAKGVPSPCKIRMTGILVVKMQGGGMGRKIHR